MVSWRSSCALQERARSRQARIEYFRKLENYSLEKEDVYVI